MGDVMMYCTRFLVLLLCLVPFGGASAGVVEATGEAVVVQGNREQARRAALEQALFHASADGGLEVHGYAAAQNGVMVGDDVAVRPTGRILSYAVLSEDVVRPEAGRKDDAPTRMRVTIRAFVDEGDVSFDGRCARQRPVRLAVVPATVSVAVDVPAYLTQTGQKVWDQVVADVSRAHFVTEVPYVAPYRGQTAPSFDYRSLMSGGQVRSGDNASMQTGLASQPATHEVFGTIVMEAGDREGRFVADVHVRVQDVKTGAIVAEKRQKHEVRQSFLSPLQSFDVLSARSETSVADAFVDAFSGVFAGMLRDERCRPLVAKIRTGSDGITVELGRDDGVMTTDLAILEGADQWAVFEVARLDAQQAVLKPILGTEGRRIDGLEVRFVGGN